MEWISVTECLPEEGSYVHCYAVSPADAEVMLFRQDCFIDLHGHAWKTDVIKFWKPTEPD